MRKLLLTVVIMAISMVTKAQTTVSEYNWCTLYSAQYLATGEGMLPGHQLTRALARQSSSGVLADRYIDSYFLYRQGYNKPIALLMVYCNTGDDGAKTYICVPDKGSNSALWNAYNDTLGTLTTGAEALKLIAYTLGKIAASS